MTETRTDLACTVCRRDKANLRARKSKLRPEMPTMYLCNECFDNKREPRYLVLLIARDRQHGGLDKVRDHIRNHRYYGEKITADELV